LDGQVLEVFFCHDEMSEKYSVQSFNELKSDYPLIKSYVSEFVGVMLKRRTQVAISEPLQEELREMGCWPCNDADLVTASAGETELV
jgi:hypothetical protein